MSQLKSAVTFNDVKDILDLITGTYTADGDRQRQEIYGRHRAQEGGWETEEQLRTTVFNPRGTPHRLIDEQHLTGKPEDAFKTVLLQVLLAPDDSRRIPNSGLPSMPPAGGPRRKATEEELQTIASWISGLKKTASPSPSNRPVRVAPLG
jgi:hypothetical protein